MFVWTVDKLFPWLWDVVLRDGVGTGSSESFDLKPPSAQEALEIHDFTHQACGTHASEHVVLGNGNFVCYQWVGGYFR